MRSDASRSALTCSAVMRFGGPASAVPAVATRTLKIDPAVVDPKDIEMLEDLVVAAITEVQKKVAAVQQEEMQKATGGMNLPFKLPF